MDMQLVGIFAKRLIDIESNLSKNLGIIDNMIKFLVALKLDDDLTASVGGNSRLDDGEIIRYQSNKEIIRYYLSELQGSPLEEKKQKDEEDKENKPVPETAKKFINIAELRVKKGLTQEQLAKKLKLSTFFIGQVESGKIKNFNLDKIKKLCSFFGIDSDDFMMGYSSFSKTDTDNIMLDGHKLRELRVKKGWQIKELAKRSNVGQSTISYAETNVRAITSHLVINRIANALDVDLSLVTKPYSLEGIDLDKSKNDHKILRMLKENPSIREKMVEHLDLIKN